MEFKPIELSDKELFDGYTLCFNYHNLEASFANIFIWRRVYNTMLAVDDIAMYIYLNKGADSFMLPPFLRDCDSSIEKALLRAEEFMVSMAIKPQLRGVTVELKQKIESDCPGRYTFVEDRSNFEYVYNTNDLANLEGRKYSSKRNHINSLLSTHTAQYVSYKNSDYDKCISLYSTWAEEKGGMTSSFENEFSATKDALRHIERLGLKCGLLYVDDKLEAFSIGEKFGTDMAIIHIEKANPLIRGSYALINREFVRHEWGGLKYINREEDMGIEGLRKAKLSYHPVFLLEKFTGLRSE